MSGTRKQGVMEGLDPVGVAILQDMGHYCPGVQRACVPAGADGAGRRAGDRRGRSQPGRDPDDGLSRELIRGVGAGAR